MMYRGFLGITFHTRTVGTIGPRDDGTTRQRWKQSDDRKERMEHKVDFLGLGQVFV